MNFVTVSHPKDPSRTVYLFRIPDFESCTAGTVVIADTSRGKNEIGICMTDSFRGDPEVILPMWNIKNGNIKPIKAKFSGKYDFYYGDELTETPTDGED